MEDELTTIYMFEVPPTMEMGSFKGQCSNKINLTFKQDALWIYNSARKHDGVFSLQKMPKGTKYYKSVRIGTNSDSSNNYIFELVK